MRVLGQLARGGHVFGLTFGQFGLTALLRAVLLQTGPADVTIWCWSIASADARLVASMRTAGLVRSARLVVDRSFPKRQVTRAVRVAEVFGEANIYCTNTHAKIALVRAGDWRVVIESSMNPNASQRIEQFRVLDDPAAWQAYTAITDRICSKIKPGFELLGPQFHLAFAAEKKRAKVLARVIAPQAFVL